MIIDCTIEQVKDYILITDLTYKPKIKNLNIQIFTPRGKIINTTYTFKKVNVFSEEVLGVLEYGIYLFKINEVEKSIFCQNNFPLRKRWLHLLGLSKIN